ncbi:MAG: hypothetical protein RLO80_11935 [Hyphomonas sp.]
MRLILAAALLLAATPATAETPPCASEAHHAFDFWIGDWDVYAQDGTLAGSNSITREEYGCLLVERWTDINGVTGQSYNYLDPATDKWRQLWISAGSVIDYTGGLTETGAMKLEGTITYRNGAAPSPFTGEWTLNEDGTVTQHFQQQDATTGEWSDWFIGKYVRKTAD